MQTLLTIIHLLTAVVLVLSVLLQSSKGSDVAGAFGGMGSQAAFGPRGTATFLSKSTMVLAIVFVITSITLVRLGDEVGGGESVLSDEPVPTAPAVAPTPAPTAGTTPSATAAVGSPAPAAAPAGEATVAPQIKDVTPNPAVPTGVRITNPAPAPAAPAPAAQ